MATDKPRYTVSVDVSKDRRFPLYPPLPDALRSNRGADTQGPGAAGKGGENAGGRSPAVREMNRPLRRGEFFRRIRIVMVKYRIFYLTFCTYMI